MTRRDPDPPLSSGAGQGLIASGLATAALDHSHDLIAVLDRDGKIVLTNAAWRANGERCGAPASATGPGVDYLEVCEQSDAPLISAGIRAVLRGDQPRFECDYPCHSPMGDAWYSLEVLPLGEPGSDAPRPGVLVTHTNSGAREAATRLKRQGRDIDPVTMLPTTPAGAVGLARMLADAQAHGHSLAVVSITLSNIVDVESLHGRRTRDEFVVQLVSRVLRLTRDDDVMVRPSMNLLLLFASVSDAQGGKFLGRRIAEVLEPRYLVGTADIAAQVDVVNRASDQFSTLDSLLQGFVYSHLQPQPSDSAQRSDPQRPDRQRPDPQRSDPQRSDPEGAISVAGSVGNDLEEEEEEEDEAVENQVATVPLVVYSLPDGFLLAANTAARSLFGWTALEPGQLHLRDVAEVTDLQHSTDALAALSSGATDSYRAHRTLMAADGPIDLLTKVRRLVMDSGALAVVLTVPADPSEAAGAGTEDPFSGALVAGTIDAHGAIDSVSAADSPMEAELARALRATLQLATHPDDADQVDKMLESLRSRGSAAGVLRVLHSEQGWVVCHCQLFTIKREGRQDRSTEDAVVAKEAYAFVLSANLSTKSMMNKITRLQHHIRRIGSEVHAADLELTTPSRAERDVTPRMDALALTARQRDIVERLVLGQRVPSIATALFISRSTVRNHLAHVYRLVGVHSQDELLNELRNPPNVVSVQL